MKQWKTTVIYMLSIAVCLSLACALAGCTTSTASSAASASPSEESSISTGSGAASDDWSDVSSDMPEPSDLPMDTPSSSESSGSSATSSASSESNEAKAEKLRAQLNISEDYRTNLEHGKKPPEYQKYIVLHDTEGDGEPEGVINYWDGNDRYIAAHFVIGRDGRIVQCVPLDQIAHHAGYGDTGHNELYGVEDESRDDKKGTTPIGDWASDYGMNSYSVGIEMIHIGGEGDYPQEQLEALDGLIAYLDAYFGKECEIIDHKAWRSGNSDTSPEFADYLANYQDHRTHD